jgi:hypothetical protein
LPDFFDRVLPLVDRTIALLAKEKFRTDPIGGDKYSRMTSVISSAYKRHVTIIETAIRERLRDNDQFEVWGESAFCVSSAANILSGNKGDCIGATLNYGEAFRALQIDLIVYDKNKRTLRAYEVKRGNGNFDSGKKRSIMRDLLSVHVLLKSYGATRNLDTSEAAAQIIFYYGVRSIPKPLGLIGKELDEHFGFDLSSGVELVNEYFRNRLYEILTSA